MTISKRPESISLTGVRTNNLKNLSCHIPMRSLTVLTGVSGSGKSSLAFDSLYAEGQRRFLESMSTYVRMFLDEMPKPPIDHVENCLPSIALRQQSSFDHPRSTVATVTELLVHMAQLFANLGVHRCHRCFGEVRRDTNREIARRLSALGGKLKLILYVDVLLMEEESAAQRLSALAVGGYQRLWLDHKIVELGEGEIERLLDARKFSVVIDRLVFKPETGVDGRMAEALEDAFRLGDGRAYVDVLGDDGQVRTLAFDRRLTCATCGSEYQALRPEFFDPNSTLGACRKCTGFGSVSGIDWNRVFNMHLTLLDLDAIIPLRTVQTRARRERLLKGCVRHKISLDVPLSSLTPEQMAFLKFGDGECEGVMGYFTMLMSRNDKFTNRIQLARFRGYTPCPVCDGTGMGLIARHVFVGERHFGDVLGMTVDEAIAFFESIPMEAIKASASETPWEETLLRLRTMRGVGLGYLTLNRKSKTLSGGESQRLYLSCGLGRGLTDTLYVLDEPTAGLHSQDSQKLIDVMKALQKIGNTLVVVEHDTDVIRQADYVMELGPCGGERGGHLIYEGDVAGLVKSDTPTGAMLRDVRRVSLFDGVVRMAPSIHIEHATIHNLKDVSVDIPLGTIVSVVGVSGSGKSTLIHDVLYQAWMMNLSNDDHSPVLDEEESGGVSSDYDGGAVVTGCEAFSQIVMMEQGALGRSARACVATMTKAYTAIRTLFASMPEAIYAGMTPGWFSFNSSSGRCPYCDGMGVRTVEMMFLNDITIPCDHCGGKRFVDAVLSVTYRGKTICDVLNMTVDEASVFFKDKPGVAKPLQTLIRVGLGYVRLGQSTATLSGGEFQRLRLSVYLDAGGSEASETLYIFDEPTVGLHMQDVANLVSSMQALVEIGASIVVIEHNLDLIAQSHYVIELGPEGGPNGGHVLFIGTPAELARADTPTGRALRAFARHAS